MTANNAKPTPVPCRKCGKLYQQTPSQIPGNRRICRDCCRAKAKAWAHKRREEGLSVRGKESEQQRKVANRARNGTDKGRAKLQVCRALKSGLLERKPCEVCGNLDVQAHHDDYSKPLDVRWLCVDHHAEHHRVEREAHEVFSSVGLTPRQLAQQRAELLAAVEKIISAPPEQFANASQFQAWCALISKGAIARCKETTA